MSGIALRQAIPILRIFSVDKAREFYVDFLGFQWNWEHRFGENFPIYVQMSRSDVVLHLSEHHGDGTPGTAVLIQMRGIEAYQRELAARNYRYFRPGIEKAPWKARMMSVIDPFGNHLRFAEPDEK